jgi:hypothetical protein
MAQQEGRGLTCQTAELEWHDINRLTSAGLYLRTSVGNDGSIC